MVSLGRARSRPHGGRDVKHLTRQSDRQGRRAHRREATRGHRGSANVQEVRIRSALTCERGTASAASATGAISHAARRSISARRWASSRRSRSASRARSSPCAPSTSAARRRSSDQSFIETNFEGKVKIRNRNVARDRRAGSWPWAAISRSCILERTARSAPCTASLRRSSEGRRGRQGQARPAYRRMGPVYALRSSPRSTA